MNERTIMISTNLSALGAVHHTPTGEHLVQIFIVINIIILLCRHTIRTVPFLDVS